MASNPLLDDAELAKQMKVKKTLGAASAEGQKGPNPKHETRPVLQIRLGVCCDARMARAACAEDLGKRAGPLSEAGPPRQPCTRQE